MNNPQLFPVARQRGIALMVMLVILVTGAATFLVSALNSMSVQIERNKTTAGSLAEAKAALIGYAATYYDTHNGPHDGQSFGFLPCPDLDGTAGANGEGSSEPSCGIKNASSIGRLPWKTLKLTDLRDGSGECLWYAVAGTYKNNPKTDLMDWDTNGLFRVLAASGLMLTGSTPGSHAVAAVFSAGPPVGNQNRVPDGSAPVCGGNYKAANYLDGDPAIDANNATVPVTANAVSQFFAAGATTNINDRIIYITTSDIFGEIKKRSDFGTFVATLLASAGSCLASLPNPVTVNFGAMNETTITVPVGSLLAGRIPSSALNSCANGNLVSQWRDNLLYATCTSSGCLTVNGAPCSGAVIFSGEKSATLGQHRSTNTDKNNWANYLEDSILTAFTTGATAFSGASSYSAASASTDVVACIP